jgi:DNA-binding transcriptional LysR family regulator
MSNNHLADLETFVAVAEAGTFTRAASRMGRSKAGVSRQIKSLEQRLGARLMNRTTRSLSLTEAGTALYERASAALAELHDAEAAAAAQQVTPQGRLRVSLPTAFGRRVAAPSLFGLVEENPLIDLDLNFSDRFVDVIGEAFDLVVRIGTLTDSSLIARRVASTRLCVCVSPSYLESHERPSTPSDLLHHECLLYSQESAKSSWYFADGETVAVHGRIRSDSGEALQLAALDGMGIAWLPDFYVSEDVEAGRLVTILDDFEADPLGIYVLYPHRRHLSLKVRLAVDRLAEDLKHCA